MRAGVKLDFLRLLSRLVVVLALAALWAPSLALAVTSPDRSSTERAEVRLLASVDQIAPGDGATLALDQMLSPGWHSYWINPGDAGMETSIQWTAPEGVEISPIQWPTPTRFEFDGLMNYGYADRATLLMNLSVPADWPAGKPIELKAAASWLVCEKLCVPEDAAFTLTLPTGAETVADTSLTSNLNGARGALPLDGRGLGAATYNISDEALTLRLAAPALAKPGLEDVYFFPARWGAIDHAAPQQASIQDGVLELTVPRPASGAEELEGALTGILTAVDGSTDGGGALAFEIAAVGDEAAVLGASAPAVGGTGAAEGIGAGTVASAAAFSLWGAALFAFFGGAILNLMPCVFPVLALKALSLANHSQSRGSERLSHGLAYGAGVLVSFLAFAGVLIGLKAAGTVVGWGFQLQTPIVVACLAYVLFAVGLNLSGVIEVDVGFGSVGGDLADRSGWSGSFFTGVLAALVASPCTAPFMGAALGYALTQDAATSLTVFAALGLGFAAPIVLLSASPGVARMMPRPGEWMVRFRQALAFPMYAAAAWLLWVLGNQAGVDALFAALIGMVLLGLAAWALGAGAPQSVTGRRVAMVAAVLALIGALFALEPALDADDSGAGIARAAEEGVEPYNAARLAALRAEGRPVFLNMTADWCISCKVNEKVVLHGESFDSLLTETDAVYMRGDWTRRDPAISAVLQEFGRVGVPLYVVYPPEGAPKLLPQILTNGIIREAMTPG
ncbi:MAG: thioredoxin family protein [Rhodobacteraceae bacterium]|nr:thioredoxin family protein [Paracoccaceae bacterium]